MSRRNPRYTDEFRASAVLMLESQGFPNKGALAKVARHLSVPPTTLRRWALAERNPPPSKMVDSKRDDILAMIRKEIAGILGDMPQARIDASYRDLGVVAGILVDKHQLLTGEATERTEAVNVIIRHE